MYILILLIGVSGLLSPDIIIEHIEFDSLETCEIVKENYSVKVKSSVKIIANCYKK